MNDDDEEEDEHEDEEHNVAGGGGRRKGKTRSKKVGKRKVGRPKKQRTFGRGAHENKEKDIISYTLPTIQEALQENYGLMGILNRDKTNRWRKVYHTRKQLFMEVVNTLKNGKLPHQVQFETPFLRPAKELNILSPTGGAPPTRFVGVTRIITEEDDANGDGDGGKHNVSNVCKFGVELPTNLFTFDYHENDDDDDDDYPHDDNDLREQQQQQESLLFQCIGDEEDNMRTTTASPPLLRNDIAREDVAGQLYAFMYRIFFGTRALGRVLSRTNSTRTQQEIVKDALCAFGGIRKRDV